MDTYGQPYALLHYKLKTARQKKRLQKEHKSKQLFQLQQRSQELKQQIADLPIVPLETPYQRGWKRLFTLSEDAITEEQTPFYQQLLDKINTVEYHYDPSFKVPVGRRKRGKWVYEVLKQEPLCFYHCDWTSSLCILTSKEKEHFHWQEPKGRFNLGRYVFSEPWRFRLKVFPHIIREVKMVDSLLEQELAEITLKIDRNHLWHKIEKLTQDRKRTWLEYKGGKELYKDHCKNMTLQTILEASKDY